VVGPHPHYIHLMSLFHRAGLGMY